MYKNIHLVESGGQSLGTMEEEDLGREEKEDEDENGNGNVGMLGMSE